VELDRNGLRILSSHDCLLFLSTARIGRIALSKNALPTIMPVLFEMHGTTIRFNASGGLLEAASTRGDIVCFEVDSADQEAREMWSVVVVGKLELAPTAARSEDERRSLFGHANVSLPMTLVSGRASTTKFELT
jgi:nitroimidazol reductase NimA-like FMN-containing flavoprotein (pyridoxamine 5'-phosphate oxidase superfamily)